MLLANILALGYLMRSIFVADLLERKGTSIEKLVK